MEIQDKYIALLEKVVALHEKAITEKDRVILLLDAQVKRANERFAVITS
jgi:hypothetical protein